MTIEISVTRTDVSLGRKLTEVVRAHVCTCVPRWRNLAITNEHSRSVPIDRQDDDEHTVVTRALPRSTDYRGGTAGHAYLEVPGRTIANVCHGNWSVLSILHI